jgi:hypothetical protein
VSAGAVKEKPLPTTAMKTPFRLFVLVAVGVPSVQLIGRGSFPYCAMFPEPTSVYVLSCAVTPDLRFRVVSPQCTQSVLPSVVKFTAVATLVLLPDNDPVVPTAVFVKLKPAPVPTPGTVAVTA